MGIRTRLKLAAIAPLALGIMALGNVVSAPWWIAAALTPLALRTVWRVMRRIVR